jgi:hypothetical protein
MRDDDMAQVVRRRDDGLRGVSNLTAALAALSIVGTGAVVYSAAHHATATTSPTTTVQSGTTATTNGGTTAAPSAATGTPVVASHGS